MKFFVKVIKMGILPVSCQRAVLTLLPKKGDLNLLKNWRPVALLTQNIKFYPSVSLIDLRSFYI